MLLTEFILPSRRFLKWARPLRLHAFLGVLATFVVLNSFAQESATTPIEVPAIDVQEIRRYTVEVIVFTYDDSESVGSEIFLPNPVDEPLEPSEQPQQSLQSQQVEPMDFFDPELPAETVDQPTPIPTDELLGEPLPEYGDLLGDNAYDFEDEELIELISADRIGLEILLPEELTMIDIHEKLLELDAYRPVMWGGWTQVILEKEATPFIRLRRLGILPLDFEGSLKLYVSRFLHLIVDVTLEEEDTSLTDASPFGVDARYGAQRDSQTPSQYDSRYDSRFGRADEEDFRNDPAQGINHATRVPSVHYKIFDDRIMKSGDIRYFDHPKFGLLIKIIRFEKREQDGQELEEDAPTTQGALLNDIN
jgi:hypothetical protein